MNLLTGTSIDRQEGASIHVVDIGVRPGEPATLNSYLIGFKTFANPFTHHFQFQYDAGIYYIRFSDTTILSIFAFATRALASHQ